MTPPIGARELDVVWFLAIIPVVIVLAYFVTQQRGDENWERRVERARRRDDDRRTQPIDPKFQFDQSSTEGGDLRPPQASE